MPSIVKPIGNAVNIGSGGVASSSIGGAGLVSLTNMGTSPQQIVNQITSFNVYVSPGATIYLEKEPTDTIEAPAAAAAVWVTPIAYKA